MENSTSTQRDNGVTRESVLKLIDQKDVIEETLRELKDVLEKNGVGMNENLVDEGGFPRQDIDVYTIRHVRHQIICLHNDHKAAMQRIEAGMNVLYSQSRLEEANLASNDNLEKHMNLEPIAKVNFVESHSPAAKAGLQVDDIILKFGTLSSNNVTSLQDIGNVVQHSVGRNIPLTVKRGEQIYELTLAPQEWSGKGLLGCKILPFESVER